MLKPKSYSEEGLSQILTAGWPQNEPLTGLNITALKTTVNSTLHLARAESFEFPVLVKQVHSNDAAAQYQSLLSVSKCLSGSRYTVPRPVAFFLQENIICMEYIDGAALISLLLDGKVTPADKQAAVQAGGRWLACYHAAYRKGERAIDVAEKLACLQQSLAKLKPGHLRHADVQTALAWLGEHSQRVAETPTAWGNVHGDFKPENMILRGESVVGIDFLADCTGTQLMDLAQFTNHLLFLAMRPKGMFYARYRAGWIDAFLAAYREEGAEVSAIVLDWLRLYHLLRYWAMERGRRHPLALLQAYWLRREIRHFLATRTD